MRKVYISGKISGLNIYTAKARFYAAADKVVCKGMQPVVPFESGVPEDADWATHMSADINMLLNCDSILMLKGWEQSKSAVVEKYIAEAYGIEVLNESDI